MASKFRASIWLLSCPVRRDLEAEVFARRLAVPCPGRSSAQPRCRYSSSHVPQSADSSSAKVPEVSLADDASREGSRKNKAGTTKAASLPSDINGNSKAAVRTLSADDMTVDRISPSTTAEKRQRSTRKTQDPEAFASARSHPRVPREHWQMQKDALKEKFGAQGWQPRKKLSPDTLEGIRALHEQYPDKYPTRALAEHFKVSPEAVRRILKSKWRPAPEKMEERRARWAKRHDRIWDVQAELGLRPQRTRDKQPGVLGKNDEIIPMAPDVGFQ